MWKDAVHAVLGPIAHAWARATVRGDGELATPVGSPIAHGSGANPDRILVMGSTVVQGVGITSYDLSFAGHLARKLAARTGRGADVETVGIDRFDLHRATDALRSEDLSRFDLILILGGVTEVLTMAPMAGYRRNLQRLFDTIADNHTVNGPVLIAGVAPFMQDMNVPRFAIEWMGRRIVRQNGVTEATCEQSPVADYIPFAPERTGIRLGRDSSAVYESWATALTPYVERAIATHTTSHLRREDEIGRQRALDALHLLDSDHDAEVHRIVEMARDMLGADSASLNFIDNDRQWTKAAVGIDAEDVPRDEAICNTTIQTRGAYVVEDLDEDPQFRSSLWATGVNHVRFYAGYPLEAPGGERVGALCVMGSEPRHFTSAETATLRDLALRAQAVLWEQRKAS